MSFLGKKKNSSFYKVALIVTYYMDFHPYSNHPWQYFITKWLQKFSLRTKYCFNNWQMEELTVSWDYNFCNIIHSKWHYKSYHSDINYHMTLSIWKFKIIYIKQTSVDLEGPKWRKKFKRTHKNLHDVLCESKWKKFHDLLDIVSCP